MATTAVAKPSTTRGAITASIGPEKVKARVASASTAVTAAIVAGHRSDPRTMPVQVPSARSVAHRVTRKTASPAATAAAIRGRPITSHHISPQNAVRRRGPGSARSSRDGP